MFTKTAQVFQTTYCSLLFLLFFIVGGHWCLRNVNLRAPEAVRSGESLTLSCTYVLEREKLYSVKFYLGDIEFYRFVPRESPPTRVFRPNGVSIKLQESRINTSVLTLHRVHRNMTGHYKCEVSADAPLFHTLIKSSYVTVTDEPLSPPYITADKLNYGIGEIIRINCTCRGGYPPADLTWYLNGLQVIAGVKHYLLEAEVDISVLELQLQVSSSMADEGLLRLRCVAAQFNLYYAVAELTLQEETPEVTTPTTDMAPEGNGSYRNGNASSSAIVMFTTFLHSFWLLQQIVDHFTCTAFRTLKSPRNNCVKQIRVPA